jgi:hypothetical protein
LRAQIRRELGVMFPRRHQPMPLRVAKWAVVLAVARRLYGTRWFRAWAFGLPTMGLGARFFYRYVTRGWTEPWGGWNEVDAVRPRIPSPGSEVGRRRGSGGLLCACGKTVRCLA